MRNNNKNIMISAEKIILDTKMGSKIYKLLIYKKTISDLVYSKQ